jgi:hypothetical protein
MMVLPWPCHLGGMKGIPSYRASAREPVCAGPPELRGSDKPRGAWTVRISVGRSLARTVDAAPTYTGGTGGFGHAGGSSALVGQLGAGGTISVRVRGSIDY